MKEREGESERVREAANRGVFWVKNTVIRSELRRLID